MRTTDLVAPDLTYRQVEHWIGQGYVPGVEPRGSGIPTEVTDEQADWIATMGRLVQAGFRPARAAEIIHASTTSAVGLSWRSTNLGTTIIVFRYGRTTQ